MQLLMRRVLEIDLVEARSFYEKLSKRYEYRFMDLYDLFQNFKIKSAQKDADNAGVKSKTNALSINTLQDQIDHLSLVCQAMCELMENIGFDKQMLAKKIQEIDLRDGKLDGKYTPSSSCRNCNRTIASRHVRCIYCGTDVPKLGDV